MTFWKTFVFTLILFVCEHGIAAAKLLFQQLASHHDLVHLNKNDNNETPFKCGLCGQPFSQVLDLQGHCKAEDHKSLRAFCQLFVCGLCPCFAVDNKESLIDHFKEEHKDHIRKIDNTRKLPDMEARPTAPAKATAPATKTAAQGIFFRLP